MGVSTRRVIIYHDDNDMKQRYKSIEDTTYTTCLKIPTGSKVNFLTVNPSPKRITVASKDRVIDLDYDKVYLAAADEKVIENIMALSDNNNLLSFVGELELKEWYEHLVITFDTHEEEGEENHYDVKVGWVVP